MDYVTSNCNLSTCSTLAADISCTSIGTVDMASPASPLLTAGNVAASSSVVLSSDSHYTFTLMSSSSRAEAAAIYAALSASPANSVIYIYTDSQTSIEAHTSEDVVLISRLDLAAVHIYILVYDDVVCEFNPRHLLKQYYQMIYMKDLLDLSHFSFISLLTDPSPYLVDWALTWHTLMFQPKYDNSFTNTGQN
ncbi:hypothetical protein RhiirB3_445770 [Rhizophagus irregularis]|nr:hypothetical protein RhiirB3_445770 [Rhizophagus irregularis]